jgi:hypothetical protein
MHRPPFSMQTRGVGDFRRRPTHVPNEGVVLDTLDKQCKQCPRRIRQSAVVELAESGYCYRFHHQPLTVDEIRWCWSRRHVKRAHGSRGHRHIARTLTAKFRSTKVSVDLLQSISNVLFGGFQLFLRAIVNGMRKFYNGCNIRVVTTRPKFNLLNVLISYRSEPAQTFTNKFNQVIRFPALF